MKSIALLFAAAGLLSAQSPHLEFEVASIKPSNADDSTSGWSTSKGMLRMRNQTLRTLLLIAYEISDAQIVGGPKWLGSDRFDIDAKSPEAATTPQLREMLRALLADRFKFVFHREKREIAGDALVVAKGGMKIQAATGDGGAQTNGGGGRIDAKLTRMDKLAELLQRELRMPVTDETGVDGAFNFTLEWDRNATPDSTKPSLFTALQEQLGLKLESRKVTADVIVIDRAEKPGEN